MKLKEIRLQNCFSQQEIAKLLDISQAAYSHYENGRRQPDVDILVKLANLYKVTLDELVGHEVPYLINKSKYSTKQLSLIDIIEKLDNTECDKVLSYIDGLKDSK